MIFQFGELINSIEPASPFYTILYHNMVNPFIAVAGTTVWLFRWYLTNKIFIRLK